MEKALEYKIRDNFEKVINEFNFPTVYKVMEYVEWYWGEKHPPSQIQMIKLLRNLFKYAIESFEKYEHDVYSSSGGFTVRIRENGGVMIEFVLEESYSSDYFG